MARVVVVGASGNVGSQVVAQLRRAGIDEIVGVARRPVGSDPDVSWTPCDIGTSGAIDALSQTFRGADAVVHLAWQIQPGRDRDRQHRTNVVGSRNVVESVVSAQVPALVYASSVGTYSPGPKDSAVDESWPTDGIPTSTYSLHKAAVERLLDQLEKDEPAIRVVRFRPGLIFQRQAASEIARYFLGPFVPLSAIRRRFVPVLPSFPRLAFQAVHTEDVGAAFVRAVTDESVNGAYNLAADPVLEAAQLAEALQARRMSVPFSLLRAAGDAAFRARLIPAEAGWLDMAAAVPVMSTARARDELRWAPKHSSSSALLELIEGLHDQAGAPTPTLRPTSGAARRVAEAVRTTAHGGPGSENP
jgi:nucleoside-diphosphate-sugar epimerase